MQYQIIGKTCFQLQLFVDDRASFSQTKKEIQD